MSKEKQSNIFRYVYIHKPRHLRIYKYRYTYAHIDIIHYLSQIVLIICLSEIVLFNIV